VSDVPGVGRVVVTTGDSVVELVDVFVVVVGLVLVAVVTELIVSLVAVVVAGLVSEVVVVIGGGPVKLRGTSGLLH